MDKITKVLQKLSPEERERVKEILLRLKAGTYNGLELKKLKGYNNIYRVRKGRIRIIYQAGPSNEIKVLVVERRSDTTYNF